MNVKKMYEWENWKRPSNGTLKGRRIHKNEEKSISKEKQWIFPL